MAFFSGPFSASKNFSYANEAIYCRFSFHVFKIPKTWRVPVEEGPTVQLIGFLARRLNSVELKPKTTGISEKRNGNLECPIFFPTPIFFPP
jgi:hypothetical protein